MIDDPILRFKKIMHDSQIIVPVPPMRGYRQGDSYIVESHAECWSYEVQDFARNETGEDGWLMQFNDPQFKDHKFVWTLKKGY